MEDKIKQSELIEDYIFGHLKGTVLTKLKQELEANKDLRNEVLLTRKIITSATRKDLSNTKTFIRESLDRRKEKSEKKYRYPIFYRVAAVLVLLITSTLIVYNVLNTNMSNDELFSKYFKIYPNLITQRTEAISDNTLDSAMKCYDRRDFECTLYHLKKLNIPKDDAIDIYEGVSYLALGITDSAIMVFNKTIKSDNIGYSNLAEFYAALCLIKQEKNEEAKLLLNEIEKNGSSHYKRQAREILESLR